MRSGRRWIVLDADFFANHFTDRILERFGPAGVCLFVALLCAAKRARIQGQITYASDSEALDTLGLRNLELVNSLGIEWTLNDFFKFTGTQKQTALSRRGRVKNIKVTHWSQWQETLTREMAAERQRRLRAKNERDSSVTGSEHESNGRVADNDLDLDNDTPLPPKGGSGRRFASNGKNPDQPRPAVADWHPDPEPDSPIDRTAVAGLRANPSGKTP